MKARPLHPRELVLLARRRRVAPKAVETRNPTVTVLVLSLDRLHLTRRCVDTIYANAGYPFELFIHDDGSQAETLEYLRALKAVHSNVELFESPRRIGCAAARDQAIDRIRSDLWRRLRTWANGATISASQRPPDERV